MLQIIEGYENGEKSFRVYSHTIKVQSFNTYEEALEFKKNYEKLIERASIKDDEQD